MSSWMSYSVKYIVNFKFLCHCCISNCEANLTIIRHTQTAIANYKEQILIAPHLVNKFSPHYGTQPTTCTSIFISFMPRSSKWCLFFKPYSLQLFKQHVVLQHPQSITSLNMTHLVAPSYRKQVKL